MPVSLRAVVPTLALAALAGCSIPGPSQNSTGQAQGGSGNGYYVNLFAPPIGGIITSDELPTPRVSCGASSMGIPTPDANGVLQYHPTYYPGASRCGAIRYQASETVTLTATAKPGFSFYGWAGDCAGQESCSLSAGADKTVAAAFLQGVGWPLSVAKRGTGLGAVTATIGGQLVGWCSPEVSVCVFSIPVLDPAAQVVLTGAPSAGGMLLGWSGDCWGAGACELTVAGPASVDVAFMGGSSTPAALSISPATVSVTPGQSVRFSAALAAGGEVAWSVSEGSAGGSVVGGSYDAPAVLGVYHVVATSVADPTLAAVATVTVVPPPEANRPEVTAFTAAGTASPVAVTVFVASDDTAVSDYLITESATPPDAASPRWLSATPSLYATRSSGAVTLYPWAKDPSGNVSLAFGAPVTLTLAAPATAARMGTNLNWCSDWDPEKLPADLIWSARPWALSSGNGSSGGDTWAPLDGQGWPLVSVGTTFGAIFEGSPWPGTYKLSFKDRQGANGDTVRSYNGNVTLANRAHDAATNVTSYDVVVPRFVANQFIWLLWAGSTGGVTDVHLMRPLKGGSGWHPIGTALADHVVDRLQWFSTIRTMQTQGGGGKSTGLDKVWSDRTSPWGPQTRSRGTPGHEGGVAIENLAAMANQVGKELWINVPFLADDDYVTRMAQTLRCGSDGTEPWVATPGTASSACKGGTPTFAPLRGDLPLYVEHGNEIWNPGAGYWEGENENLTVPQWRAGQRYQFAYTPGTPIPQYVRVGVGASAPVYKLASANGASTGGRSGTSGSTAPSGTGSAISDGQLVWSYVGTASALPGWIGDAHLDYDGTHTTNLPEQGWQRMGYLAVRVSLLFRQVFGDAEMMTRVRPVFASQHGRYAVTILGLDYIRDVWTTGGGHRAGTVGPYAVPAAAAGVSYYVYGLATAPYVPTGSESLDPTSAATLLDGTLANLASTTAGYVVPATYWNVSKAAGYGLRYLAYEGGDGLVPDLMPGGSTAAAVAATTAASFDPVQGRRMGAAINADGTPAADQRGYVYGRLFAEWEAAGGDLFVHFTLGEAANGGSMFGLCAPTSMVPGADLSKGTSSSDCRYEVGPKWDAIKAFSRAWNR